MLQNDVGDRLYIIETGEVEFFKIPKVETSRRPKKGESKDGDGEILLSTGGPGVVFGEVRSESCQSTDEGAPV